MINGDNKITVIRADKLDIDARFQISEIFADGFTQWLIFFSKDKNTIAKAFAHMFVLDQFYVAVANNKVAGVAACTDCRTLSVKLDKKELRKHLGFFKGSIAGIALKKEFERAFENPPLETGSIEFVGTAAEFRGRGVASQIISHIISNTPYREYLIEEVADTNTPAMNLYKKLGFKEYRRIPITQNKAKKIGINNFIAFKYIK
ncbi:N-acetyltransferase [Clostridium sp. AL.422]|uniref:GNAT family N-acetyltransferase n=1 Tax=Clostridium TaxID=1485 RepID=UPI00293DF211|nr:MULTISPECIES: N-acetyltransferase [unclassified Clostridium]MDV4151331.1 N-acetyltransferase [Clostridium sp. AL.422]